MLKKLLLCSLLVLAAVSSAFAAESFLWGYHASLADITDGKSDYSNARFYRLFLDMQQNDVTVTDEHIQLEGYMTIPAGTYSFIKDGVLENVSGTSQTFRLADNMEAGNDFVEYFPVDDNYRELDFLKAADGGLNGVTISWNFPKMPSFNGSGTVPNFRTTQEQMNNFVPYVEYIRDGSNVIGITWRIVNPSDTSTAITQNYRMRFRIYNMFNHEHRRLYRCDWQMIPAGEAAEGTLMFDEPISESAIWGIETRFRTFEEDDDNIYNVYNWQFMTQQNPKPEIDSTHVSNAPLVNGKPDYTRATFVGYDMPLKAEGVMLEADHFTSEGVITIPGGGYTVVKNDTGEELETVSVGDSRSFGLRMISDIHFFARDMEYVPVNDAGEMLRFAGSADSSFSGKTFTWTFPASLKMNGSQTFPEYKSTSEQLDQCVPYVELVSADGKITAVNYKLVNGNTGEEVNPSYRTEILFELGRNELDWQEIHSGTWTLENPVAVSEFEDIYVELRSYEDDSNNPSVYRWWFNQSSSEDITPEVPNVTPTPTVSDDVPGSSGGGCTTGLPIAGLIIAASLFITKKR